MSELEKLGQGGVGVVHKARHAMLRRPTAIKFLAEHGGDPKTLARFEREVQLTSELTHPNTIAAFGAGGPHHALLEQRAGSALSECGRAARSFVTTNGRRALE
jgi:serine/threonine protein kinase